MWCLQGAIAAAVQMDGRLGISLAPRKRSSGASYANTLIGLLYSPRVQWPLKSPRALKIRHLQTLSVLTVITVAIQSCWKLCGPAHT